jgi:hypothetical protein
MRPACLLLAIIMLITAACEHKHIVPHMSPKDSLASIKWPDTPDFDRHTAPLFRFIQHHRYQPAFDTMIAFDDQGFGGVDNFYNFVQAGKLFDSTHEHMLLFYDFGMHEYMPHARMLVYVKHDSKWCKVLDDTTDVSDFQWRFIDWNSDGIADLSYVSNGWEHGGHGPISWWLWLVDKKGLLHRVKGFDDLDNPIVDSITSHIFTNTVVDHRATSSTEYKFAGNRIVNLGEYYSDFDTADVVRYSRNGHYIKTIKLKPGVKSWYTPKHDTDDWQ